MIDKARSYIKSLLLRQKIFLGCLCLVLGVNFVTLAQDVFDIIKIKKVIPYVFEGRKFSGLEKFLDQEQSIGYYTDRDLDNFENAKQLAQAQYMLSPIILDVDNYNHNFLLLDCEKSQSAMMVMGQHGFAPYKKNSFGIILAKKK